MKRKKNKALSKKDKAAIKKALVKAAAGYALLDCGKRGGSMSRDEKIWEAYLLVSAYMRAEDVTKAREALERWAEVVKGVEDVNYPSKT